MKVFALLIVLCALATLALGQEQCPRCTPFCEDGNGNMRSCGPDGCGGNCGLCAGGQECCRGECVCSPNCAGRACGDDGCGGNSCGMCSSTQTCSNGQCIGTPVAECAGRVCGDNRAGGSCGGCANGQRCRGGVCECYYDCNERVCGNAVQPDGANFGLCPQRACGSCPAGLTCDADGLCNALAPCDAQIHIFDCDNLSSRIASTASVFITETSETITVFGGGPTVWGLPDVLGRTFTFSSTASGYQANTQTVFVDVSTTDINLCMSVERTVMVEIREWNTEQLITFGVDVSFAGATSGSFFWTGPQFEWAYGAGGSYTFSATPGNGYWPFEQVEAVPGNGVIVLYVFFCGDTICDADFENSDRCFLDCVALLLEFENADGSGTVNDVTVNYYATNPRDQSQATGPNKNGAVATTSRGTGTGSNTVLQTTYSFNEIVYVEAVAATFINFYWTVDTSVVDVNVGTFRLRIHSSNVLGTTDFNYRVVNTWRPIDDEPPPYSPTDLNLHVFHPEGALDINNPSLIVSGFSIGRAVSDSKQSGGPAAMDISPGAGQMLAVWNSKPPRSRAIAPSQAGRYLVDSQSYVVVYGKTSNASNGKQLGEVTLEQYLTANPAARADQVSDLWYVMQLTVSQSGIDQPSIVPQQRLKAGNVNQSTQDLTFDCEAYGYCSNFIVPFSDSGRK